MLNGQYVSLGNLNTKRKQPLQNCINGSNIYLLDTINNKTDQQCTKS